MDSFNQCVFKTKTPSDSKKEIDDTLEKGNWRKKNFSKGTLYKTVGGGSREENVHAVTKNLEAIRTFLYLS